MAESESENRNTKQIPNQTRTFPRNLLQAFVTRTHFPEKMEEKSQETEEIELTLGLSMGGRFGVDPEANEKLRRASSISNFSTISFDSNTLLRTCSLPTETEDSRKRKELQSMRRMVAKRKRTEKRSFGVEVNGVEEKNSIYVNGFESKQCNTVLDDNLVAVAVVVVGGGHCGGNSGGGEVALQSSQGSVGSQGSGSSGITDLESQSVQGANTTTKEQSPSSVQSNQKPFYPPPPTAPEKPTKMRGIVENPCPKHRVMAIDEGARNVMEEMPCVSTRGDGPNGRKIEGFLYRYRKGEEVRIVCVCHGQFLSPAEFVKHGGGGDVTHPLRHIVVNTNSLL